MKAQVLLSVSASVILLASSSQARAWDIVEDARAATTEKFSTHLFIVQRALQLLKNSSDATAKAAAKKMESNDSWKRGLFEADFGAFEDKTHMGAHFYNPNPGGGKNGKPGGCHTWGDAFVSCHTANGNARVNAKNQIAHFSSGKSVVPKKAYGYHNRGRIYALGVALHFLTDVTMPFHAAGYSGLSYPIRLHAVFESDVKGIQASFVQTSWTPRAEKLDPDAVLVEAAWAGKGQFNPLIKALNQHDYVCVYGGAAFLPCYRKNGKIHGKVKSEIGKALLNAQEHTADYIRAVFQAHPERLAN